jgi:multiple sugar transport system ATP-binding protein
VALGRAVVRRPRVFLFDEPLANLDAQLRDRARTEIARLQQKGGATSIYVTHDQSEALALGDRVAVVDGGRLQQIASPHDVYQFPANRFVAGFIGRPAMNFLAGRIEGGAFVAHGHPIRLTLPAGVAEGDVELGVRPESIALGDANHGLGDGVVDRVEWLGDHALVHLQLGQAHWFARVAPDHSIALNSKVPVTVRAGGLHLFAADAAGARLLSF